MKPASAHRASPVPPRIQSVLARAAAALNARQWAPAEALARHVLTAIPNSGDALLILGSALAGAGRLAEAEAPLRAAAEVGENPHALLNYARLLQKMQRLEEAEHWYVRVRSRMPKSSEVLLNLGAVYLDQGRLAEALRAFKAADRLTPRHRDIRFNMAVVLVRLDRLEEAEALILAALDVFPGDVGFIMLQAEVRVIQACLDDAVAILRKAVSVLGPQLDLMMQLAHAHHFKGDELELAALEDLAAKARKGAGAAMDRVRVLGAWSKVLDELGRTEEAFIALTEANSLRRANMAGDMAAVEAEAEALLNLYTPEVLADLSAFASHDPSPVFIVGMPRSGTSMTEHLLAAHPDAVGLGETEVVGKVAAILDKALNAGERGEALAEPAREAVKAILGSLRTLAGRDAGAARLVDKMPMNFHHLGLIGALFPRATLLVMRRDPLDTCLSCFRANFRDDLFWSFDLEDLGRYYRLHEHMIEVWRERLGTGRLVDVVYEDLTADPEAGARRLLEAVGLPWNDCVLQAHAMTRGVKTSSAIQVREPIHRRSVGRAARYGRQLDPLRRALGLEPTNDA